MGLSEGAPRRIQLQLVLAPFFAGPIDAGGWGADSALQRRNVTRRALDCVANRHPGDEQGFAACRAR